MNKDHRPYSQGGNMQQSHKPSLPSRKSIEEAMAVIEGFRDLCRFQMEVGYWATIDFPSKHHLNKILQLGYRKREELVASYGEGLARHIYELLPACRAYVAFVREPFEQREHNGKVENQK